MKVRPLILPESAVFFCPDDEERFDVPASP
jgi:hypothetical protein